MQWQKPIILRRMHNTVQWKPHTCWWKQAPFRQLHRQFAFPFRPPRWFWRRLLWLGFYTVGLWSGCLFSLCSTLGSFLICIISFGSFCLWRSSFRWGFFRRLFRLVRGRCCLICSCLFSLLCSDHFFWDLNGDNNDVRRFASLCDPSRRWQLMQRVFCRYIFPWSTTTTLSEKFTQQRLDNFEVH